MIAFVRHGETAPNVAGALLGRTDVGLTERGAEQAAALAVLFAREPVTAVVSSPLRRAVMTATAVADRCGVPVEVDERLIELDYGEWEGRRPSELGAERWQQWRADPSWAPPGGESLTALYARVASSCADLGGRTTTNDGGVIVAVSHVSPVKAAVAWALDVGTEISWRMHLRVASITRIGVRDTVPYVLTFNETNHLGP